MAKKSEIKRSKPIVRAARRPRRKINWAPVLVLAILTNSVIACYYSGLTAVRKMNVVGARPSERLRLEGITRDLQGKPAMQIAPRVVEYRFNGQSRILKADFRRNIFGIANLTVQYRKPVLQVGKSAGVYLDELGHVFGDPEVKEPLPKLKLDREIQVMVISLAGVIDFQQVSNLTKLMVAELDSPEYPANNIEIEVFDTGGVCLNMRNGRVMLGTFNDLELKIEALKKILIAKPDLFTEIKELNLMAPDKPSRIDRNSKLPPLNGGDIR